MCLSSCSEFIVEEPTTSILNTKSFSTRKGIEANVVGIYSQMDICVCNSAYYYYFLNGELFRDWKGNRVGDDWEQSHYMTMFSKSNSNATIYQALFTGINRCNASIEGVEACGFDEDFKTEIIAECRFLRAVFYFYAVRLYGDVPLIDFNPKTSAEMFVKRSPYQKIYRLIMEDLDFAEKHMRTREKQEEVNPDQGRSCNFAATAIKVMVYAQMACYLESPFDQFFDSTKPGRYPDFSACGIDSPQDAWRASLQAAETVINDPLSPYRLEPDFRNLFRWDPEHHPEDYRSPERILTMVHTPKSGENAQCTWALWKNPYGTLALTGSASNSGRVRPNRIVWHYWNTYYGGGFLDPTDVVYTDPTPDPRLPVTYQYNTIEQYSTESLGAMVINYVYPAVPKGKVDESHYFRKGYSPAYNVDAGNADYYQLRLADIYLAAADAACALGDNQKAIDYINALHRRARESVDPGCEPAVEPRDLNVSEFSSREELEDRLLWEQLFETHGEDKEWYLHHRRGARWLIKHVIKPFNEFSSRSECAPVIKTMWLYDRTDSNGNVRSDIPDDIETVRKCLICAYPDYELRYNTSLTSADQNEFFLR